MYPCERWTGDWRLKLSPSKRKPSLQNGDLPHKKRKGPCSHNSKTPSGPPTLTRLMASAETQGLQFQEVLEVTREKQVSWGRVARPARTAVPQGLFQLVGYHVPSNITFVLCRNRLFCAGCFSPQPFLEISSFSIICRYQQDFAAKLGRFLGSRYGFRRSEVLFILADDYGWGNMGASRLNALVRDVKPAWKGLDGFFRVFRGN